MSESIGTWSEASQELDAIVQSFDDGEISVDDLIDKLERASFIIDALERRLSETRATVDELVPRITPLLGPDQ